MVLKNKKIVLTGGAGFLGSRVLRELTKAGVPKKNIFIPRSRELNLRVRENCEKAVKGADVVIHLAALVGGIGFNQKNPGRLFYDNLIMGVELMEAARKEGVEKFVALGTICAYPKYTTVHFNEETLWDGYPEETNAPYGLAKKMLLVQAQSYRGQYNFNAIYLLPVNLYGPGDNFDPKSSHVIPALIKKVDDAQREHKRFITVWGSGKASREFLYVDDAARAIVLATEAYSGRDPVNIGAGFEIPIKELIGLIASLMGYTGEIHERGDEPNKFLDSNLKTSS